MYDAANKGSTNYLNLARELLQKNNMTRITNDERFINMDDTEEQKSLEEEG